MRLAAVTGKRQTPKRSVPRPLTAQSIRYGRSGNALSPKRKIRARCCRARSLIFGYSVKYHTAHNDASSSYSRPVLSACSEHSIPNAEAIAIWRLASPTLPCCDAIAQGALPRSRRVRRDRNRPACDRAGHSETPSGPRRIGFLSRLADRAIETQELIPLPCTMQTSSRPPPTAKRQGHAPPPPVPYHPPQARPRVYADSPVVWPTVFGRPVSSYAQDITPDAACPVFIFAILHRERLLILPS